MRSFILRRFVQMIPTVFGVVVITFVLFNLVGDSPGRMALGEKASPQQVDDFNEKHGFNKPVLFGRRIATPAFLDHDLARHAGPWGAVTGVVYQAAAAGQPAYLRLAARPQPPLAFPLRADVDYEWTLRWRTPGQAWQTAVVPCPQGRVDGWSALWPATGEVHLAEVRLRRLVAQPWDSQFLGYLSQLARLDFGTSISANLPVLQLLKDGLGPTLLLATPILFTELVVSVAMGLLCAFYRGRWLDRAMVFVSVALMSINYLVWIVAGQYLLAFRGGLFPVWGFESAHHLVLPVLIGVISGLGGNVRFYRTVMLDEVYKDYVRTAYAKGVSRRAVLFKHVLRNAMVPIITNVMLAIPFLYTGSLLLESYFGIPGVGYLSVKSIFSRDPDVIRAVVLLGSMLYIVVGVLGDLLAARFDPRIKLS